MAESKGTGDKRAQHVALFGALLQALWFGLLLGIAAWAGSSALLRALAGFMLFGIPVWLVLYFILKQITRVELEALETAELRRAQEAGATQALFELDDEALLLEQNRLKWMVQWLLPAGTIVVAVWLLWGIWNLSVTEIFDENLSGRTDQPKVMMVFVLGVAFLSFLYARYSLAVARLPQWGLLRGGGVCMAGCALAGVVGAVALMLGGTFEWAEPSATLILRFAMFVLGVEFAGNFILDLYRPRVPGEVARPAFDSRLLGMIGEPGGLAKSIADAANYQFGFNVSSTWFYQLLQRWLFPITVAAAAVVLLMTSVVIVGAEERVVIEHFGHRPDAPLTAGLYFKWPYPIDISYRAPTGRIREVVIGEAAEENDDGHGHDIDEAILWTKAHESVPEMLLLVAAPKSDGGPRDRSLSGANDGSTDPAESEPVSLLMMSVPIEYRIRSLPQYLYKYAHPEGLLEAVAYQHLSEYASGVELDVLIGSGRVRFNADLKRQLQARLDAQDVGIEIVAAGIRDAHPPAENQVAAAFQQVLAAEIGAGAVIHAAEAEARKILIGVAGTEARAKSLDEAIRLRDGLPMDSPERAVVDQRVQDLVMGNPGRGISRISGKAAEMISAANGRATNRTNLAAAKALSFSAQVAGYKAAPVLYLKRQVFSIYRGLQNVRKYLIVGDRSNIIIEYDTMEEAGLDQVLGESAEAERKKARK